MRTLGRRAAIGATSAALLLAALETSLATVRAARHEGGITGSGLALPASPPALGGPGDPGADPGTTLPPTADPALVPETGMPVVPSVVDPITGLPVPAPGTPGVPGTATPTGTPPAPGAPGVGPRPAGSPLLRVPGPTVSTNAPVSGPTPTTAPVPGQAGGPTSCPSDRGRGALPHATGRLRAVDFSLPWPGSGPVVLVPHVSAKREKDAPVWIAGLSIGSLASDGSSLTLATPLATTYVLVTSSEQAAGSIRFRQPDRSVHFAHQACRDRRLALYDVGRGMLDGSPVRIVGMVAPAGMVTIAGDGGTAYFRSAVPGVYSITLLTANDAGTPGTLVTVTVDVP